MKKIRMWVAAGAVLLLAACGTTKQVQQNGGAATSATSGNKAEVRTSTGVQSEAVKKLSFVQKVYDNQVYTKNIVGSMSFNLQVNGKSITVPGSLHMRKDEVIRMQLFIPILGTEVGRLEFTPNYVLIIDRLHKEYIKADYTQVDFLKKQGVNFYSLQALFWNQLLVPGNKKVSESDLKKFDAKLDETGESVPVSINYGDMNYVWNANRTSGRITEAMVSYKSGSKDNSHLNIKYGDFKSVGVKMFPASQSLTFATQLNNKQQEAKISFEMNEIKTDSNWSTETEVSGKYKQVSPEDVLGKIMSM